MGVMALTISVLAERPDLLDDFLAMESPWPTFMRQDPIGALYYNTPTLTRFAEHILVCQDDDGQIVAKAFSIPFRCESDELPDDGWDGAIRRGVQTSEDGGAPNTVAALEIVIAPSMQGRGLSGQIVEALRDNAKRHGFRELVVPVRPNAKQDPREPMSSYAFRTRDDGLPVDPWLRVHVRAGGRLDKVAPRAMVIPGTLEEWRDWTGLPFDRSGLVEVPQALTLVHCDVDTGTAVYIEPNVWVRHSTGA